MTPWSLQSNTQSRRHFFLPKDRKDPVTFSHSHRSSLPSFNIFTSAWLSSAGSCHLRQSSGEEPQVWWTLSKTPASPISTFLLLAPLQTSPCQPGGHTLLLVSWLAFSLLLCAPSHLTVASVPKRGQLSQQNPRASAHWIWEQARGSDQQKKICSR